MPQTLTEPNDSGVRKRVVSKRVVWRMSPGPPKTERGYKKTERWTPQNLDGGNSALVIGFLSRQSFEASRHHTQKQFGASKLGFTKARLLKHDLPVHGKNRNEGTKNRTTLPKTGTRVHSPKPPFYNQKPPFCFLSQPMWGRY